MDGLLVRNELEGFCSVVNDLEMTNCPILGVSNEC